MNNQDLSPTQSQEQLIPAAVLVEPDLPPPGEDALEPAQGDAAGDELVLHQLADTFPPMQDEELYELVADIKANGLHEPVTLFEGKILDGRNRFRACREAGIEVRTEPFEGTEEDARAFVVSKNLHRRHLTAEQKRALIAQLIKAEPEKSDRQIAKQTGAHHTTVGTVRREEEGRGGISHVEKRVDTRGRRQPVKRRARAPENPVPKPASDTDGNGADPEASAEARKALYAADDGGAPAPASGATTPAAAALTQEPENALAAVSDAELLAEVRRRKLTAASVDHDPKLTRLLRSGLAVLRQANGDKAAASQKAASVFVEMNSIISSKKLGVADIKIIAR
jgi:ParB-like chromosome segregation protein Spo0J